MRHLNHISKFIATACLACSAWIAPNPARAAITPSGQITTSFGGAIDIYHTTASQLIAIGFDAPGSLIIDEDTEFNSRHLFIGSRAAAIGGLTVSGPQAKSITRSGLKIGFSGIGQLNLKNGAYAKAAYANIGVYNAGFLNGSANIQDPDTHFEVGGILAVGQWGNAALEISNGAKVTANSTDMATYDTATALINLRGANSQWITTQSLFIGRGGTATLNITGGASAQAQNVQTAVNATAEANITLQGASTQWQVVHAFKLGINGQSTLSIKQGATLNIGTSLAINDQAILNIAPTLQNNIPIHVVQGATLNGELNIITDDLKYIDPSQSLPLINIGGVASGQFQNRSEGDLVASINQYDFYLTYLGGDGNDIHLTTQTTDQMEGDINNDGLVNHADLLFARKYMGSNSFRGDANHDGVTDLGDLFSVRNYFMPVREMSIPEPTSLLTFVGLSLMLGRRRLG